MTTLDNIETRVKSQSRNVSHEGIGIDAIHDMYMDYLQNKVALADIAYPMAGAIKTVMSTQTLTASENARLTNALAGIIGDVNLAQAYVDAAIEMTQEPVAEIDSRKSMGDNESKKRSIPATPQEYYAYAGEIGKRNDLTIGQKVQLMQEAYEALGDGNRADVLIPADVKYLTEAGFDQNGRPDYNWPKRWGMNGARAISRIANVLPKILMRSGFLGGNTFTELPADGIPYTYDEMSLPYIPNSEASHQAVHTGSAEFYFDIIDAIREKNMDALNMLLESNGLEGANDEEMDDLTKKYELFIQQAKERVSDQDATYGLYGTVEKWINELTGEIYLNGGAPQYTLPLSVKQLIRLGIYKEKEM
jgi:hypothetical protein